MEKSFCILCLYTCLGICFTQEFTLSVPDFYPCHINIVIDSPVILRGYLNTSPLSIHRIETFHIQDQPLGNVIVPTNPIRFHVSRSKLPVCSAHIFKFTKFTLLFEEFLIYRRIPENMTLTHRYAYEVDEFNEAFVEDFKWTAEMTKFGWAFKQADKMYFYNFTDTKRDHTQVNLMRGFPHPVTYIVYFVETRLSEKLNVTSDILQVLDETLETRYYISNTPRAVIDRIAVIFTENNTATSAIYLCSRCINKQISNFNVVDFLFSPKVCIERMWKSHIPGDWAVREIFHDKNLINSTFLLRETTKTGPFHVRLTPNLPFESTVLGILVQANNLTIHPRGEVGVRTNIPQLFGTSNIHKSVVYEGWYFFYGVPVSSSQTFVVTSSEGYNFATCFSYQEHSYRMYIIPFQPNLWYSLVGCVPLLAVILYIYILHLDKKTIRGSLNPPLMFCASLVEQSCYIPQQMERQIPFRIVVGMWFLLLCIFTNGYKGAGISELTAPLTKRSAETFDNLTVTKFAWPKYEYSATMDKDDFWFVSSASKAYDSLQFWNALKDGYSSENPSKHSHVFTFTQDLYQYYLKREINYSQPLDNLIVRLLYPQRAKLPKGIYNFSVQELKNKSLDVLLAFENEKELVQCGRVVNPDRESTINREFKYLAQNYHWISFFKGREPILKASRGWHFLKDSHGKVERSFKSLLSNGIYNKLEEFYFKKLYQLRLRLTRDLTVRSAERQRVKPIGIFGNIQTIFLVALIASAVSLLTFTAEHLIYRLSPWYLKLKAITMGLARIEFKRVCLAGLKFLHAKARVSWVILTQYFIRINIFPTSNVNRKPSVICRDPTRTKRIFVNTWVNTCQSLNN